MSKEQWTNCLKKPQRDEKCEAAQSQLLPKLIPTILLCQLESLDMIKPDGKCVCVNILLQLRPSYLHNRHHLYWIQSTQSWTRWSLNRWRANCQIEPSAPSWRGRQACTQSSALMVMTRCIEMYLTCPDYTPLVSLFVIGLNAFYGWQL